MKSDSLGLFRLSSNFFWTGNRFRVILLVRLVRIKSHSCTEKMKIDLREMFIFLYIYNKQITAQKVLCTDFYSLVAKLWKTQSFAPLTRSFSKVLQVVNEIRTAHFP